MNVHGSWVAYSGTAQIVLAAVLAAIVAAAACAAIRLPLPARLPRPGQTATTVMIATWGFAVLALLVCGSAYKAQASQQGLQTASPLTPITPITLTGAVVVFLVIARARRASGRRAALGSAVIGAIAGPMIFELPFDLIVMARTYPVVDPAVFRPLLFAPLILTGLTTLALLSLPPTVQLRRTTLCCLTGMLAVFAVWSLADGFAYPSAPGPLTLNAVSKILALAAALTMFIPDSGASAGVLAGE